MDFIQFHLSKNVAFITESNKIEGIHRNPTFEELEKHSRFLALLTVTVSELEAFVSVYQPDAKLRIKPGQNVRVGDHRPPPGGPNIKKDLQGLLIYIDTHSSPYDIHLAYESLHPFTDCNGRSGRMLWAWQMNKQNKDYSLGFLHTFYYQALSGVK